VGSPFSDTAAPAAPAASTLASRVSQAGRSTVLPRVEAAAGQAPRLVHSERPRYQDLRVLGAGGMGEVSLVRDEDIQRTVAVKRLHADLEHPLTLARFAEEVRTIGSLEHPNIVPVHDVGLDEAGRYFFVMKHVEGETLEHVIERLRAGDPAYVARWSVEARLEVFVNLLHALAYAHERGIVHRDVKPANVMVGRHGEVVLMDWGIAKRVGGLDLDIAPGAPASSDLASSRRFETALGSLIGTPAYMSPEQASGHNDRIDARSDLYSACVLLHELLALKHPLDDKTTLDELVHSVRNEVPSFVSLVKDMPAEWAHFLTKGLKKAPEERFQSATEMIDRIQRTLEGVVPVQCHVTMTKRMTREAGRFVDRHKQWAFAGFVASVGLAAYGIVAIVLRLVG
jgi:serine/threonine-protein kinase